MSDVGGWTAYGGMGMMGWRAGGEVGICPGRALA